MGEIRQALLVIDVQRGLFEKPIPIYRADELLDHVTSLASNAHRAGVTVIYVQHASKAGLVEGSTAWQLHPRLKPLKKDVAIQKSHPSAFEGTELGEVLLARGVKRLILTGLVTHGCVCAPPVWRGCTEATRSCWSKTPTAITIARRRRWCGTGTPGWPRPARET
jgi:nicotinamidase-related amidase